MLKRDIQHRKLNNKGMTLVEIIITITLLVLVSSFILSAFVSAMRSATKSRELHRATTVAQNVMEGINLASAEELAFQFDYPYTLDSTGTKVNNFGVYPTSMLQYQPEYCVGELTEWADPSGTTVLEVVNQSRTLDAYNALDTTTEAYEIAKTKSAYMADMTSNSYVFLKDSAGKYIYYIRNLENDGAYYNAKITLNAAPYRSGGTSGISVNSEELISVPTIDSAYDAVEVMKQTLDNDAITELQRANPSETVTKSNLHRKITIDIQDALMAGPEGLHRTKITVYYEYYFIKANGTKSKTETLTESYVFNNEGYEDVKQLRNIYLYYYPMYKEGTNTDSIFVKNENNLDVELYVIKQETPGITYAELSLKEQYYTAYFNVKETTTKADGSSHIELHSNWNENLYAIYSATPLLELDHQVELRRNTFPVTKDIYNMTDIKNKKENDRIYDVTVEIYESEKATSLSDFSAVTEPSKWFEAENHLITMTSSISQ